MKNIIIAILMLTTIWLSLQVVRLERYHYASFLGMCEQNEPKSPAATIKRSKCLNAIETRTNDMWHLYFGVTDKY